MTNKQLQLAIVKTNNSDSCSTHVVQDVATICQTRQSKASAFPYLEFLHSEHISYL